ncbi:MAG: hypothetical protein OXI58_00055 [Gemmatimonadota bacterium]|nr:hypothetical protein [Gemmatimonadota bacterium]
MPRLIAFAAAAVFVLSCSSPTAQNPEAAQEEIAPWETVSINGAAYRRVAAKPTATQQDLVITLSIPVSLSGGQLILSDQVTIAGRVYRADCSPGSPTPTPTPGTPPPPPTGDDVGNTPATATALTVPYPPAGSTATAGWFSPTYRLTARDVDYFRLEVTRPILLAVGSRGGTDTVGELQSAAGEVLHRNDDGFGPGNPNFFVYYRASPGTYYVKVRGYGAATQGDYVLGVATLNDLDAASAEDASAEDLAAFYEEQLKEAFQ